MSPRRLRPRPRACGAFAALLAALCAAALAACSPSPSTATTPPSPSTATAGGRVASGSGATGLDALRGTVITIDPGHNGGNGAHPGQIRQQVFVGNGYKQCDTVGTQTGTGYPEHAFTWDLANRLAVVLRSAGARVVLTRGSDAGVGPCIAERAAIGNRAHSDLAISIHADGGPATGSGFHVIEPAPVGANAGIVALSRRLGGAIRDAFHAGTGEPFADYTAHEGIAVRDDLGGLNLSQVPKIFLECGNMRNSGDADRLGSSAWRRTAARAIATGMAAYVADRAEAEPGSSRNRTSRS